jgi:hypothetical protein
MAAVPAQTGATAAGYEALACGDWPAARAAFEEALAVGDSPEALDGLGLGRALWWLREAEYKGTLRAESLACGPAAEAAGFRDIRARDSRISESRAAERRGVARCGSARMRIRDRAGDSRRGPR